MERYREIQHVRKTQFSEKEERKNLLIFEKNY